MAHFLVLLISGAVSAALFEALRALLVGTLDPAVVPLVSGLAAWSMMIFVILLRNVERRFTSDQRFSWLIGAQLSLVQAVMQGAPLWRLPSGHSKYVVIAVLAMPVIVISQITACALFTREERDGWTLRTRRRATGMPDTPTI